MKSWYVAVFVPRIWGGAVSAWYIGTAAESPPTPRPATRRPTATETISFMRMEKRFRLRTCELIPFRESGELDDDSDEKDDAFKGHGVPTANEICETSRKVRTEDKCEYRTRDLRSSYQSANERSYTEQGNDQATAHVAEIASVDVAGRRTRCEPKLEVFHDEDVRNLASVVAEDEAAHGCDEGEHDGEEADGEAVDVQTRISAVVRWMSATKGHCEFAM